MNLLRYDVYLFATANSCPVFVRFPLNKLDVEMITIEEVVTRLRQLREGLAEMRGYL